MPQGFGDADMIASRKSCRRSWVLSREIVGTILYENVSTEGRDRQPQTGEE
jgi:hypothetical protein